jgi:hypothetical protein
VASVIEKVLIAALGEDEDHLTAPPGRLVEVEVIGGFAHVGIRELTEEGVPAEALTAEVVVPARSLVRALTAAIEDDEALQGSALRR